VKDQPEGGGLRVELDDRKEKVNLKIREAQLQKIPYMLVVGDREAQDGTVSVRNRKHADQGAQTGRSNGSRGSRRIKISAASHGRLLEPRPWSGQWTR
jgi:threonyl-tRNA synthetase